MATAITLADRGVKVVVHEKRADVGMRFSKDFQGLENWTTNSDVLVDLANLGLTASWWTKGVDSFRAVGPGDDESYRFSCRRPLFYLVQRGADPGCIDAALRDVASGMGVDIRFSSPSEVGDADVVASGPQRTNGIVYGRTFRTESSDAAVLVCDDAVAPKGYGYLLIAEGRGTLAVVVRQGDGGRAHQRLDLLDERVRRLVDFDDDDVRDFGANGAFAPALGFVRDGAWVVGEASGLQDFLFGFGMRSALVSGVLAAKSILNQTDYPEAADARFGRAVETSLVNRYIYERMGGLAYSAVLGRISRSGADPVDLLARIYGHSWKTRLIAPWVKWRMRRRFR